ncbi:hypothetical protein L249_3948 [Ophiocordyceps polyrhachis-furcata BCC 54312]|uniref:ATP12 chaperone protein n=1 Tax=Ophiocordyceps polyrhachis-furcata BCC 54312 TaxID=1330021 RepID=A0A367L514_9HYPO|nr:hypothetical protein L249_3948 [Ophiocordyceps polyrhachis-furcata BCC 54312]
MINIHAQHCSRLLSRLVNGSRHSRFLQLSVGRPARVSPDVGAGPPPDPPTPTDNRYLAREARRYDAAADLRVSNDGKNSLLRKRFWQGVSVRSVNGALEVYLDERPLKHPRSKKVIRLPPSKPILAIALAVEWDRLTSAQQATKEHLVPLTSIICRALDIEADDGSGLGKMRGDITANLLKYLDTDSLLCWVPPANELDVLNDANESLRDVQKRAATDTVTFLTMHVWPGVTIEPVLDGHSLSPRKQAPGVREIVQGWVQGLSSWELAGLERAVLAGKSLLIAARLVAQWSEEAAGARVPATDEHGFRVEDAVEAVSIEVDWQTEQWGEVEDAHDVNHEDLQRQLGSVVLLVSGTRADASNLFPPGITGPS